MPGYVRNAYEILYVSRNLLELLIRDMSIGDEIKITHLGLHRNSDQISPLLQVLLRLAFDWLSTDENIYPPFSRPVTLATLASLQRGTRVESTES